MLLGVNINYSDFKNNLYDFVYALQKSGANSVTLSLSDDMSVFYESTFAQLKNIHGIKINLKIPVSKNLQITALNLKPHACYIVSETKNTKSDNTLNVAGQMAKIISFIGPLFLNGINPVPFISPEFEQIEAAANTGVRFIELNALKYAEAFGKENERAEFEKLKRAAEFAQKLNLTVKIGHGLNYLNVIPVSEIDAIHELNIGHVLDKRTSSSGFENALRKIKALTD